MIYRGYPAHCGADSRLSVAGAWLLRPTHRSPTYAVATDGHVMSFVVVEAEPDDVVPARSALGPWPAEAWPGSARTMTTVRLLASGALRTPDGTEHPAQTTRLPDAWIVVPTCLRDGTPPREHGGLSVGPLPVAALLAAWGKRPTRDNARPVHLDVDDFGVVVRKRTEEPAKRRRSKARPAGITLATAGCRMPTPHPDDPTTWTVEVPVALDLVASAAKAIAAPSVLLALPAPLRHLGPTWDEEPVLVLPADERNPNWALVMPLRAC